MFGERLKALRQNKNLSQKELGAMLHVSYQAVGKYERGEALPSPEVIMQIARIFSTSMDYLMDGKSPAIETRQKGIRIPVLGSVVAGIPVEAIEDIIDWEEITPDMASSGEFFALQIKGDSMEPRMMDGDVVIVRKLEDVETGNTAIVLVNGNEATCKKIKKTPEGVMLIPTNPAHVPWFYANEEIEKLPVKILGKVVELRAKY